MNNFKHFKIYLSFSTCDSLTCENLARAITDMSKNLMVYKRIAWQSTQELVSWIDDCDIFVSFVTYEYFKSNALNEFDYSFDHKKKIMFLFDKNIENIQSESFEMMKAFDSHCWIDENDKRNWSIPTIRTLINKMNEIIEREEKEQNNAKQISKDNNNNNKTDKSDQSKNDNTKFEIAINSLDINKLEFLKNKKIACDLGRSVVLDDNRIAFIAMTKSNVYKILIFDSNVDHKQSLDTIGALNIKEPKLIACNSNSEIIILDGKTGNLHIFDKSFGKPSCIPGDFGSYNDMAVDMDTNDIYLVRCVNERDIKVVDYKQFAPKKDVAWKNGGIELKSFYPRTIKILNNRIYIVNVCSFKMDVETRQFEEIKFGASYILILDKQKFHVINKVDLREYSLLQPWSLIVDKNMNIYTTAYEFNESEKKISKKRVLCKINPHRLERVDIFNLNSHFLANDMFFLNNRLILYKEDLIDIYQLMN